MKRFLAILLAALLLCCYSVAFCEATAEDEVIEIVWLTSGTDADFNEPGMVNYECLKDYHASQDKVRVNVEYYANQSDLFEVIQMKLAAGTSEYDVISVDSPMVAAYAYHNWLMPLDEFFTAEELADFTDSALQSAMYNGKLYAPALQDSSIVMCYNTDLLAQAGITIRENDVENRLLWDEVVQYATDALKILDPDHTKGITGIEFNQVGRVYEMNMLPNSLGGTQIAEDGFSLAGVLDSEPWTEALTWYQELVNAGICSRGIKPAEAPNNFYSDKTLFYITTVAAMKTIEKNIDHFDYTCVPAFRGYEDLVSTPCGSWNIGVNIDSEKAAAAADFVKYMTIGHGNDLRFKFASQLPARRSQLNALMSSESTAPRYMQIAAYEASNTSVLRAQTPAFNEYSSVMDTLWDDIRNGSDIAYSVQSAISTMDMATESYR